MKKILLISAVFCWVSFTANAQITVTSANYINIGTGITQKVDTMPVAGIVPGNAGANVTYNFSALHTTSLTVTSQSTFTTVAAGVLGSSYSVTPANVCMHQDTMYFYFDSSSTKLELWGSAGNLLQNAVNNAQIYSNPQTIITFPSTYNTNFKDTANYDTKLPYGALYQGYWVDSVREKERIITVSKMDGWGTVTTPNATFPCLRQNVLKHSVDSTWGKIVVGSYHYWINLTHDTSSTQSYSYISSYGGGPIVDIEYYADSSKIYQVRWNTLTLPIPVISPQNVLCHGGNSGSANVISSGGTGPYTYSWNTTPVQTTATATGLSAGTYTVTVTDAVHSTQTAIVTITQPSAVLTTTMSSTNETSATPPNGTATSAPSGGTGPYTYSWSTSPSQTTAIATGLAGGTYTITITDAHGCTVTNTVVVINAVGVTSVNIENSIEVYPNPNSGEFTMTLNTSENGDYTIVLSNLLGQVIYNEALTNFSGKYTKSFDVKTYGEGIYLMRVFNKTGSVRSTKIAIIH